MTAVVMIAAAMRKNRVRKFMSGRERKLGKVQKIRKMKSITVARTAAVMMKVIEFTVVEFDLLRLFCLENLPL